MTDIGLSGVDQELLNDSLRLLIFAFAENMMQDAPLGISEVEGRPIFIAESAPYRIVAVNRDRIFDAHVCRGPANVLQVSLERELRRMHADHDQSKVLVFPGPRAN